MVGQFCSETRRKVAIIEPRGIVDFKQLSLDPIDQPHQSVRVSG